MKRIFVTGGAGFIAGYVIEHLLEKGYEVITNVRDLKDFPKVLRQENVSLYNIDIRDKAGIYSVVEKCDGVIHLAGILGTKHVSNAWNFYEINLRGVLNILEACKEYDIPMVGIGVGNYWMLNNYANSKYAAEREILKYAKYGNVRANVVRGLNAYGPRQKFRNTGKIIPTFIVNALSNQPLEVYGGEANCGIMDMIYVGDLAKVLVEVLEKTDSGEYEVGEIFEAGTGKGYSVYEIAQKVIQLTGSSSKIKEVPMRSGEVERSEVVAKHPYPIEYSDWEDTLMKTIYYYKGIFNLNNSEGDKING